MKRFFITTVIALVVAAPSANAAGRWCARTTIDDIAGDCSFASYRQCQATISGQGGDCFRNPRMAYGRMSGAAHVRRYGPANAAGMGNNGNSFYGSNSLDNANNFGNAR